MMPKSPCIAMWSAAVVAGRRMGREVVGITPVLRRASRPNVRYRPIADILRPESTISSRHATHFIAPYGPANATASAPAGKWNWPEPSCTARQTAMATSFGRVVACGRANASKIGRA